MPLSQLNQEDSTAEFYSHAQAMKKLRIQSHQLDMLMISGELKTRFDGEEILFYKKDVERKYKEREEIFNSNETSPPHQVSKALDSTQRVFQLQLEETDDSKKTQKVPPPIPEKPRDSKKTVIRQAPLPLEKIPQLKQQYFQKIHKSQGLKAKASTTSSQINSKIQKEEVKQTPSLKSSSNLLLEKESQSHTSSLEIITSELQEESFKEPTKEKSSKLKLLVELLAESFNLKHLSNEKVGTSSEDSSNYYNFLEAKHKLKIKSSQLNSLIMAGEVKAKFQTNKILIQKTKVDSFLQDLPKLETLLNKQLPPITELKEKEEQLLLKAEQEETVLIPTPDDLIEEDFAGKTDKILKIESTDKEKKSSQLKKLADFFAEALNPKNILKHSTLAAQKQQLQEALKEAEKEDSKSLSELLSGFSLEDFLESLNESSKNKPTIKIYYDNPEEESSRNFKPLIEKLRKENNDEPSEKFSKEIDPDLTFKESIHNFLTLSLNSFLAQEQLEKRFATQKTARIYWGNEEEEDEEVNEDVAEIPQEELAPTEDSIRIIETSQSFSETLSSFMAGSLEKFLQNQPKSNSFSTQKTTRIFWHPIHEEDEEDEDKDDEDEISALEIQAILREEEEKRTHKINRIYWENFENKTPQSINTQKTARIYWGNEEEEDDDEDEEDEEVNEDVAEIPQEELAPTEDSIRIIETSQSFSETLSSFMAGSLEKFLQNQPKSNSFSTQKTTRIFWHPIHEEDEEDEDEIPDEDSARRKEVFLVESGELAEIKSQKTVRFYWEDLREGQTTNLKEKVAKLEVEKPSENLNKAGFPKKTPKIYTGDPDESSIRLGPAIDRLKKVLGTTSTTTPSKNEPFQKETTISIGEDTIRIFVGDLEKEQPLPSLPTKKEEPVNAVYSFFKTLAMVGIISEDIFKKSPESIEISKQKSPEKEEKKLRPLPISKEENKKLYKFHLIAFTGLCLLLFAFKLLFYSFYSKEDKTGFDLESPFKSVKIKSLECEKWIQTFSFLIEELSPKEFFSTNNILDFSVKLRQIPMESSFREHKLNLSHFRNTSTAIGQVESYLRVKQKTLKRVEELEKSLAELEAKFEKELAYPKLPNFEDSIFVGEDFFKNYGSEFKTFFEKGAFKGNESIFEEDLEQRILEVENKLIYQEKLLQIHYSEERLPLTLRHNLNIFRNYENEIREVWDNYQLKFNPKLSTKTGESTK